MKTSSVIGYRVPGTRYWLLGACFLMAVATTSAHGQMERQRADPGGPVDDIFWAPSLINMASVTNLPARNLNFTIRLSFGIATFGENTLLGLDDPANIRFGLDYGITDRLSVGFGRSRFDKLWDFQFQVHFPTPVAGDPV